MSNRIHQFYECDNPGCRLRFPVSEGLPRCKRCPVCRSTVHLVAVQPSASEQAGIIINEVDHRIEALLDNIRSAWNVGSIFRTADGTGIRKLYLCGITPSPDNPKVGKTALGAENSIAWEKHNNAVSIASQLKSTGYQLWALEDTPDRLALFEVEKEMVNPATVLVVGNEVSGVDPGVIELCDKVITIPMVGRKQSYNVSVAFGIAASFLLYRQIFSHGSRNIFPHT